MTSQPVRSSRGLLSVARWPLLWIAWLGSCNLDRGSGAQDPSLYATQDAIARVDAGLPVPANSIADVSSLTPTDDHRVLPQVSTKSVPAEPQGQDGAVPPASPRAADMQDGQSPHDDADVTDRDGNGMTADAQRSDAGTPPQGEHDDDDENDESDQSPDTEKDQNERTCVGRKELERRAETFLRSLAAGSPSKLPLGDNLRYTENGREMAVSQGLWSGSPNPRFAHHFIDEQQCGTVTVALLMRDQEVVIYGARLRYETAQLIDIESFVIQPDRNRFEPEGVARRPDPWLTPPPEAQRMSRDELQRLGQAYFDSAVDNGPLPPHSPTCERRQNGALIEGGACDARAGNRPFENIRYPVIDETQGVLSAFVLYNGRGGFYLFKAADNVLHNIDIIGGVSSMDGGWQ